MIPVVLSCEHAVKSVPATWVHLFRGSEAVLESHRGWDPGTLELARALRTAVGAPLVIGEVTRLLVELNRAPNSPEVWSEFSRPLPELVRLGLMERYFLPYRNLVRSRLDAVLRTQASVVHLSVHSFTPVWHGRERAVDIGLLFDPTRPLEVALCTEWSRMLEAALPDLRIRFNEPYAGVEDGLTTSLRTRYPAAAYAGLEIEVSQRFPLQGGPQWAAVQAAILSTFVALTAARARPEDMELMEPS